MMFALAERVKSFTRYAVGLYLIPMSGRIVREFIAFVCALVLFGWGPCSYAGELRTAYQKSYPKYFEVDVEGKKVVAGLCVDIIRALERELPEVKVLSDKTNFSPFKRIQGNLASGKIEVFFGLAKSDSRLKRYVFVEVPLYEVNHVIAMRGDDDIEISNFDDIRSIKGKDNIVLTNFATATEQYLKKQGGLHVDSGAESMRQNIVKLLKKRGRFVYFHNIGLIGVVRKYFKESHIKILPASFKKYHHYVAFSKKVPKETIEKISAALKELAASGELLRIQEKYTKF